MSNLYLYLLYVLPVAFALWIYLRKRAHVHSIHAERLQDAVDQGLNEPATLHPVIDPRKCLGSGACVSACPEQALGIINGKGYLVNASACIGHGACMAACPHDAIHLVFGTETRGVDIPMVKPNFETNVPGIFIAGELGGMGLIRKAAEQGSQAIESIVKRRGGTFPLDVVIVGAGPAGIAASLGAMHHKLRFVTIEQESSIGGSVYHYPRQKIVMTAPVKLPLIGKVKIGEISKEKLLDFWRGVVERTGVKIHFAERMERIIPAGGGFIVKTSKHEYRTRNVLLAIGRSGTPRKLDVPGEEQSNVVYRLLDPSQYRGQRVLVVGGGDSALEAALAVADEPQTVVSLSYRGDAFSRAKAKNRQRIEHEQQRGRVRVLLESNVKRIARADVQLDQKGRPLQLRTDVVIVSAGGILPTAFLRDLGVMVETKFGTA